MSKIADEYLDQAAQELASDIDFGIITDLFIAEKGWTKVVLKPMTWEDSYAVDLWVAQHVKSKHCTRGLVWVFENPAEATWFRMRWYE